jgi:hypothetical protein
MSNGDRPESNPEIKNQPSKKFSESFEREPSSARHQKASAPIEFTTSNTEQIPYKPIPNDERKLAKLFASIFSEVQKLDIEPGSTVSIHIRDKKSREIEKNDVINAKQKVNLHHISVDEKFTPKVTRDQEGLHLHGNFGEMDFRKYLVGGPWDPGFKLGAPLLRATLDKNGDIKMTFKTFVPKDRRNTPDELGNTHPYEYMCKNIGPMPSDAGQLPKVTLQPTKDMVAQGKKYPPDLDIVATDTKQK